MDNVLFVHVKLAAWICSSFPQDVVGLFHKVLHSGPEREAHLKALSKALRDPSAQLIFIKYGGSFLSPHQMSLRKLLPFVSVLLMCRICCMYTPVFPPGGRTACIFWLVSSLALMLRVACRLFGVFMSCLTLPTPAWHQPVCLPLPTCSPTCLVRAPSSLWVPACTRQCVILSPYYAPYVCFFLFPCVCVYVYTGAVSLHAR